MVCDDGNDCTDDSCDAVAGCLYVNNAVPCNDGNACTVGDACSLGSCVGGMPKTCDDADPCTEDACDPASGMCVHPNRYCKENLLTCGNHFDPCNPMLMANCGECSGGEMCSPGGFCQGADGCTATDHGNVATADAKRGAFYNGHVYVGDLTGGIKVIDVMDPENPEVVKDMDAGNFVFGVEYHNDYLYGCDPSGGMQIFDLIDPTDPQPRGHAPLMSARLVNLHGNYAYVARGGSGLEIVDISNPDAPLSKKNIMADNSTWDSVVAEDFLYISDKAAVYVYDVVDPTNPAPINQVLPPDGTQLLEVEFSYPYAYFTAANGKLYVLDAMTPGMEVFFPGSLSLSGSLMGFDISYGYGYVADTANGVHIVDVAANPQSPSLVETYDTAGTPHHAFFQSGYLMVSNGTEGFHVATAHECYQ